MRTVILLAILLVAGGAAAQDATRRVEIDPQVIPRADQRFISERLERLLETTPSGREIEIRTLGGTAFVRAMSAVSRATGAACGDCDDSCRPYRCRFQAAGEITFPVVEGLRCRVDSGRWISRGEKVVGESGGQDAERSGVEAARRAEERRRQDAALLEEQQRDAQRRDAARQADLARQDQQRRETEARDAALREDQQRRDSRAAAEEARRREAEIVRAQDQQRREADIREAASREAARLAAARQAEAARRQADAALRETLGRMLYVEGEGEADLDAAIRRFLSDHRQPLSTPRERVLALARAAVPVFDRIPSCPPPAGEPLCRE